MPNVKKQVAKPKTNNRVATRRKTAGSAVDRIGGMEFDPGIKMAIYGRTGTGKTTLWSSWPGPILSIITSGGKNPGELRSINTPALRKKVSTVNVYEPSEVFELIEYQATEEKFNTVILDHATSLQDMVMKGILGIDEIPVQSSWGMATQQQWGQCAMQMKELFRKLLGLTCNVVIVAQEREFNNDGDSDLLMPFVGPAMTPSVTGWLNPAVDYIVQTFIRQKTEVKNVKVGGKVIPKESKVKGVEYCLRTGPDPIFTTKFRVPKGTELPDVIVDPSYEKVGKLIGL